MKKKKLIFKTVCNYLQFSTNNMVSLPLNHVEYSIMLYLQISETIISI